MRSAAQMFHAYTRAPWTSKTSSIATRKRMANKHHCRNWHRQVIFLHTPWLQGTCNHMQGCAGSLAGSVNRAGGAARWEGRAPVIVAVAVDGPARTTPLVHVAPCTPRSHSTAPRQAAQPAPGLHSSGQARERPGSRCTATAGAGADPCHAWHAAAGPAAGRAGCSSAPKEGAIGVYGHGAARGAGPTGNQVHERAARQTAQLEHGAARR